MARAGNTSSPKIPGLCSLPLEILGLILKDLASSTRIYQALELRLVNKTFDEIILDSVIFYNREVKHLSSAICTTALQRWLCNGRSKHIDIVRYIEFLTNKISEIDGWKDRNEVYSCLSRAASVTLEPQELFRSVQQVQEAVLTKRSHRPDPSILYYTDDPEQPIPQREAIQRGSELLYEKDYVDFARALVFLNSSSRYQELENIVHAGNTSIANICSPYFGTLMTLASQFGCQPEEQALYLLKFNEDWNTKAKPDEPLTEDVQHRKEEQVNASLRRRRLLQVLSEAAFRGHLDVVKKIILRLELHQQPCFVELWVDSHRSTVHPFQKINLQWCDLRPTMLAAARGGNLGVILFLLDLVPAFALVMTSILAENGDFCGLDHILTTVPTVDYRLAWNSSRSKKIYFCDPWTHSGVQPLLPQAARSGNDMIVMWLLMSDEPSEEHLFKAMISAVICGYHDIFNILLQNFLDSKGSTDLKLPISLLESRRLCGVLGSHGRPESVELFFSKNPKLRPDCASEILVSAAYRGDRDFMQLLLEKGFDSKLNDGFAYEVPSSDCAAFLERRGVFYRPGEDWKFPIRGKDLYQPKVLLVATFKDRSWLRRNVYTPEYF